MTTKKEKTDWRLTAFGIGCVTVLEIYAMSRGMNGTMLMIAIGIIGYAIGVKTPDFLKTKK